MLKFDLTMEEFKEKLSHYNNEIPDGFATFLEFIESKLEDKLEHYTLPTDDPIHDYVNVVYVVLNDGVLRVPYFTVDDEYNPTEISIQYDWVKEVTNKDKKELEYYINFYEKKISNLKSILEQL